MTVRLAKAGVRDRLKDLFQSTLFLAVGPAHLTVNTGRAGESRYHRKRYAPQLLLANILVCQDLPVRLIGKGVYYCAVPLMYNSASRKA